MGTGHAGKILEDMDTRNWKLLGMWEHNMCVHCSH